EDPKLRVPDRRLLRVVADAAAGTLERASRSGHVLARSEIGDETESVGARAVPGGMRCDRGKGITRIVPTPSENEASPREKRRFVETPLADVSGHVPGAVVAEARIAAHRRRSLVREVALNHDASGRADAESGSPPVEYGGEL